MLIEDQVRNVRNMVDAESKPQSRIIAVTSGKGGVGKSNIALNVSIALAEMGRSVTLLDTTTQSSGIGLLAGQQSPLTLKEAMLEDRPLSDIMVRDDSGVNIVSADCGSTDPAGLEDSIHEYFFRELYGLQFNNDIIVLDTAAILSDTLTAFAQKADQVVVVTTPEPAAVSDAYALMKVLYGMKPDISFQTLINMVESKSEAEEVFERFSLVVQHFLQIETDLLGYLVEDKAVRLAVKESVPVIRAYPKSQVAKCIRQIAQRVFV